MCTTFCLHNGTVNGFHILCWTLFFVHGTSWILDDQVPLFNVRCTSSFYKANRLKLVVVDLLMSQMLDTDALVCRSDQVL